MQEKVMIDNVEYNFTRYDTTDENLTPERMYEIKEQLQQLLFDLIKTKASKRRIERARFQLRTLPW